MERIKLVALILLIPFLLICCSPSGEALDYEAPPFSARFALSLNGINIMGNITAGALTSTPRDVHITFEDPKSLSGISIERKNGIMTTSLDGIVASFDSTRWLAIAELFELRGTVTSAKNTTLGGTNCILADVKAKNEKNYSVYIDKNGFPLRICGKIHGKTFVLDIIQFKQDVR